MADAGNGQSLLGGGGGQQRTGSTEQDPLFSAPGQQIQQMLNSGRVSQAQYNQAVQQAQQLARMLGINPGAQG